MRRILFTALAALALTACGGGGDPVDQNHEGDLAAGQTQVGGHNCDTYDISVGEGWTVRADMDSEWDNKVILTRGDAEVASDDDTDGTNARLNTTVTESGDYTVNACAYSDGTGAYTLHIVTAAGN
ncbi:MAG: lipoprotein [Sandaracinaceae bacterium]